MHSSDSSLYGADSDSPLLDAGRDLLDVGGGEDAEAAVEISAPPHLVLLLIDIDHVSWTTEATWHDMTRNDTTKRLDLIRVTYTKDYQKRRSSEGRAATYNNTYTQVQHVCKQ